ncbi:hypothetical protein HZC09_01835 [Candidatus Micrarchaeota archaeon]|nr:hypothetical protein [Candidatus Micrarchaeota archaeon]
MRTTLAFEGVPVLILDKAVEIGLAKSKTDALRMGIFALNREYHLVDDVELEMVGRKIEEEKAEMKRKGLEYLPKEKALAKYR